MNNTDFLTDRPVTYRDMQLEQLRQKYAGMAMQAIISNPKYYKECISLADEPNSGFMDSSEVVAEEAVHFAALIDRVCGRGTWESNPYVLAYDFELVTNCNRLS